MLFNPENVLVKINEEIKKAPFGDEPAELYEPIRYFMRLGGKRLRPLLTVFGTWLYSEEYEKALLPSLGVEIFHNFTLMHDDIMDNAPLRRNQPTVHEKWNENVAILAGDVMLVKAYEYLLKTDESLYPHILPPFNRCAAQVCEGQQYDVNFETKRVVAEAEYLEMIRLKTAVLLGYALQLGGIIGGADQENQEWLRKAGENMGIAFQLKDDLLDVFGDQKKFGKQVGGDIIANKKTFLLIKAMERAGKKETVVLKEYFSGREFDPAEKVKVIREIYERLDIQGDTDRMISRYIDNALNCLHKTSTPLYKKNLLKNYFLQLARREN